jgi:hypothetical protein
MVFLVMKRILLIAVIISFIIASCKKDNNSSTTNKEDDWIKLEIPNAPEAYAVAGDIDDTLLVATWTKAYFTADRGKTWQESKTFDTSVEGLYMSGDTVMALMHFNDIQADGIYKAISAQYYTLNFGKTWYTYNNRNATNISQLIGIVQSPINKATYKLKFNTTSIPGPDIYIHHPTDILKNGNIISFPFKRRLENLYLDKESRLYVTASGGTYNENTDTFDCCPVTTPALIYISKKPMPQ